jgi:hypothetical protein
MNVCGKRNIGQGDGEGKGKCLISEKCYPNAIYMIWGTKDDRGLMIINKKVLIILG